MSTHRIEFIMSIYKQMIKIKKHFPIKYLNKYELSTYDITNKL